MNISFVYLLENFFYPQVLNNFVMQILLCIIVVQNQCSLHLQYG